MKLDLILNRSSTVGEVELATHHPARKREGTWKRHWTRSERKGREKRRGEHKTVGVVFGVRIRTKTIRHQIHPLHNEPVTVNASEAARAFTACPEGNRAGVGGVIEVALDNEKYRRVALEKEIKTRNRMAVEKKNR